MQISWKIFSLPLTSAFVISKGTFTHRRTLIVQLKQDGCVGLGEATEISYYGISLEKYIALIREHMIDLQKLEVKSPADYFAKVSTFFGNEPFLLSAFDCAAHDLYGHLTKKKASENLQIDLQATTKPTSYTIGIGNVDEMAAKIKAKPWPIYKIKLGTVQDIKIMRSVRQVTDAVLRVDANEGWTEAETIKNSKILHDLNVEFIEQPMPRVEDGAMKKIISQLPIPFIADESCQTQEDVRRCQGKYDGINIKLMKCGGLTIARQMIEEARSLDLKIMIGCMTESSIGISAAAQLIPLVDFVDLDGSMLIEQDIATGVSFADGYALYPDRFGLGCQLLTDKILITEHGQA